MNTKAYPIIDSYNSYFQKKMAAFIIFCNTRLLQIQYMKYMKCIRILFYIFKSQRLLKIVSQNHHLFTCYRYQKTDDTDTLFNSEFQRVSTRKTQTKRGKCFVFTFLHVYSNMSEGQGASAFPLPPMQYVNNYTDDSIKRGKAPLPPPPVQVSETPNI